MKYLSHLPTDPFLWALALLSVGIVGSLLFVMLTSITF